jgi:tetratricopeptide (TPR) repeat protein
VAILASMIGLAFASEVKAQPAPPQPEDSAPTEPSDDARARRLYADGDRRYAEGRYAEAIESFSQAFELSGRSLLLFNMANTYERMGDYARAADSLRRYLGREGAEDVDTVRQRLRQLERRAKLVDTERKETAALRARPPCPDPISCQRKAQASDRNAYILLGTGGVALVSAAVFAGMARNAHNDALGQCVDSDGQRYCPTTAQSALDRERRFALFSDLSSGLGLAAVGTGVYLLLKHRRARERRRRKNAATSLEPRIMFGGIGVDLVGGF